MSSATASCRGRVQIQLACLSAAIRICNIQSVQGQLKVSTVSTVKIKIGLTGAFGAGRTPSLIMFRNYGRG